MLKKHQRLSRKEFETLLKNGARLHHPALTVVYRHGDRMKCGVVVGKKVSRKATERSLIRRQLFASLRNHIEALQGVECAVLTRPTIKQLSFSEREAALLGLVQNIPKHGNG